MNDIADSKAQSVGGYVLSTAVTFAIRMSKLVMGLGVVVAGLLYWKQDSMLYFPGMSTSWRSHSVSWDGRALTCIFGVAIAQKLEVSLDDQAIIPGGIGHHQR
jgi:hypothetical protein